jgi:adenine-specific DNA methylase
MGQVLSIRVRWLNALMVLLDEFEPYRDAIPEAERGDLITAYHKRITGADSMEERLRFARLWYVLSFQLI